MTANGSSPLQWKMGILKPLAISDEYLLFGRGLYVYVCVCMFGHILYVYVCVCMFGHGLYVYVCVCMFCMFCM